MSEDNPNTPPCGKYNVNIDRETLINICIKKWVLEWCGKYHPEAFEEAEKFIREILEKENLDKKP